MIDARGLTSPMPELMIQKAMKSNSAYYEMIVDSKDSCDSVKKFSENLNYSVDIENKGREYLLKISK